MAKEEGQGDHIELTVCTDFLSVEVRRDRQNLRPPRLMAVEHERR